MNEKEKNVFQRKTDELILELKNMFGELKAIELIIDKQEKAWLVHNLSVLREFDEVEELSYEDIEIELKGTLVFKIKKEFAEMFFKEELGIVSVEEEEELWNLIEATKICFFDRNVLEIESEDCSNYPKVVFINKKGNNLHKYILNNSTCEEIRSIQMKCFFKNGAMKGELVNFIDPKLNHLLRSELTIIQSKLNDYHKNKMNWIIELNNEYIFRLNNNAYILKAAE